MFRTSFDAGKKQWRGVTAKCDFNPETSLGNVILNSLKMHGARVAQICAETNISTTFEELYELTVCAAKNLRQYGCQKGDMIFFTSDNTADMPALVFAALCLGCTISSMSTCLKNIEYTYFFGTSKPKFIFCDLDRYEMMHECCQSLNNKATFFTFNGQAAKSISVTTLFEKHNADPYFEPAEVNGITDIAFICRSSGTSGLPKGVCLSHASLLDKVRRLSHVIKSTDVVLGYVNVFGVNGVRALVGPTLNGATRIVNPGHYSQQRFLEIVEQFKVTLCLSASYMIVQLLNHPKIEIGNLSSVTRFICGGGKASFDVIEKLNQYLPNGKFGHNYGMTEMFGTIAMSLDHTKNDCVGQLIGGCEAKIINEHGERLSIGGIGELCVKLPYPFLKYLGDEESSRNCFDSEGFYLTGDIVYFDENGDLFIIDRKKEVFKVFTYNVTPMEIELFLDKLDGVKQSCVVPIPYEDCEHLPAAVIVKSKNSNLTEDSVYISALNNFAEYKKLGGGVYFVDALPVTSNGKIARHLVKKMALEFYNNKNHPIENGLCGK